MFCRPFSQPFALCRDLISIFHFVCASRFGQQEARETWQLLKLLPVDVRDELLEAAFD